MTQSVALYLSLMQITKEKPKNLLLVVVKLDYYYPETFIRIIQLIKVPPSI